LIRILRKGIGLQSCDKDKDVCAETVCASAFANFTVAPRRGLSFYEGSNEPVPLKRIALGVMLAKLTGADRDKTSWDDIEGCLVSVEAIKKTGATAYQDGKGETAFNDVNGVHWAVEKLTVKALSEIVEAAVSPLRIIFVPRYELVAEYDYLVERQQLTAVDFGERASKDLDEVRNHRRYRRVKRELDESGAKQVA